MDYLIQYDDIKKLSLGGLLNFLKQKKGLPLREVSIDRLTSFNEEYIFPGTGVYIFRDKEKLVYVGKASSMSFIERVPKHFDPRTYAWMNRLLELVSKKVLNEVSQKDYKQALGYVLENYNLLLIHINDENKSKINILEDKLRGTKEPLNRFKTKHSNLDDKI